MLNVRGTRHSLPNRRKLTVIAQDPSIRISGKILTADVDIPAEKLLPGPCGHRVKVVDFDASTNTLYEPADIDMGDETTYDDRYAPDANRFKNKAGLYDATLLGDPRFHAQNVYAIVMRTLARFEFALGRRVAWGSDGHQLHVAPHAFAEANAFYSRADQAIFFGYFVGNSGKTILLFQIGKESMLFPGDAQIENWSYALSNNANQKLLANTNLYKVGHHGSRNATPKSLWALFKNRSAKKSASRLIALMSTMEGKHGSAANQSEVPRKTLVDALKKDTDLFTTQALAKPVFFHDTTVTF